VVGLRAEEAGVRQWLRQATGNRVPVTIVRPSDTYRRGFRTRFRAGATPRSTWNRANRYSFMATGES
jgi:hypothetical protein